MENGHDKLSEVFLSEQNFSYAQQTLKTLEKLAESSGSIIDSKSRYLCEFFKYVERNDLRAEAARMGVKADIDKLMSKDDKLSITEEVVHELKKRVAAESRAGIHDDIHVRLAEFVGYVHETGGDFKGALRFYVDANPEKYGDISKYTEPSLEDYRSELKERFQFSEIEDDEMRQRQAVEKFKELTEWLIAETSFMQINPDETFSKLLGEARTIMASAKKKE